MERPVTRQPDVNFTNLTQIFNEALARSEPTLAFAIQNGIGEFVFMMFFSDEEEDQDSKDRLFLFLARTAVLLKLKLYGHHPTGDFKVFLTSQDKQRIKAELGIQGGQIPFDFERFLNKLNAEIPQTLPLRRTVETLSRHRSPLLANLDLRRVVDEAAKTYLIGPRNVADGAKPRERTLRKLYWHIEASPEDITEFIDALKARNMTLGWTDNPRRAKNLRECWELL